VYRDGWVCTVYEPTTREPQTEVETFTAQMFMRRDKLPEGIPYDGTEGELYNLVDDPLQFHNLWDDPSAAAMKRDLIADLYDTLPKETKKLAVEAPA
jgi:hypothetical protein